MTMLFLKFISITYLGICLAEETTEFTEGNLVFFVVSLYCPSFGVMTLPGVLLQLNL